MKSKEIEKIFKTSYSKSEACSKMGFNINGNGFRKLEAIVKEFNIDISHFNRGSDKKRKYELITKKCPICSKEFSVGKNQPKEKQTCSYACSNSYFRSGINNPNWKVDSYRTTCFLYHEKKCVVCSEDKIVDVHHYDENKHNNNIENLIPLCPTHHAYWHSRYKNIVKDKVEKYRNSFILNIKKMK